MFGFSYAVHVSRRPVSERSAFGLQGGLGRPGTGAGLVAPPGRSSGDDEGRPGAGHARLGYRPKLPDVVAPSV